MSAHLTIISIVAVELNFGQMDCCDDDTAHVWVSVSGWSPRRAFLTGAAPFAAAAECTPSELMGRYFTAELDLDNQPGNEDTAGERLEWPALAECPPLPPEWATFGTEKTTTVSTTAGAAVTPNATRLDQLRNLVTIWGGEWTTRRVQHLYQARYNAGLQRHHAREDLTALAAEGLLVIDETETSRRVYQLRTGGHRA